jgi:polyferredoxin
MQGQIENMYRLKLINKTQQPRRYALGLEGGPFALQGPQEIALAPGEIADLPVSVTLLENARDFSRELRFKVSDLAEPSSRVSTPSTFVAPIAALRQ